MLDSLLRDVRRYLNNFRYEKTDDNRLYFAAPQLYVGSVYEHRAPDGLGTLQDHNLIPTEGLTHIWSVLVANGTQNATWYVAIYGGNVSPAASWTAANFTSNSTELTTAYSEATRVEFVESTPASGSTNNTANRAVFTAAQDNVNVYGAALLSASGKGATTGTLLSAAKFTAVRNLPLTGDDLSVGITLTATSA